MNRIRNTCLCALTGLAVFCTAACTRGPAQAFEPTEDSLYITGSGQFIWPVPNYRYCSRWYGGSWHASLGNILEGDDVAPAMENGILTLSPHPQPLQPLLDEIAAQYTRKAGEKENAQHGRLCIFFLSRATLQIGEE